MTVTSDKLQVSFAGADVVAISNQRSGQTVLLELIMLDQVSPPTLTSRGAGWNATFGAANCATSLNPSASINAPAAGATGTISVTTGSNCNWSATSGTNWITVTPSSGVGNGTVKYTIAANAGPARFSAPALTIAGHPVNVAQAAAPAP